MKLAIFGKDKVYMGFGKTQEEAIEIASELLRGDDRLDEDRSGYKLEVVDLPPTFVKALIQLDKEEESK